MQAISAVQQILHERFSKLKIRNPSYSIRAFSKKVGVSAGTLSLVMLGKRTLSKKLALKVVDNLMLDPQERSELLSSYLEKSFQKKPSKTYLQLKSDQYFLLHQWHYFAILNLVKLKTFKNDIGWISKRLGISKKTVKESLDRLKRLGLIEENKQGKLLRKIERYRTTDDVPNSSLRKSHHDTLDLAKESLDTDSVKDRDFTWITFPLKKGDLDQIKTRIRKFQDDLLKSIDTTHADEVYRIAIQVFPLTKMTHSKKGANND